MAKTKTPPTRPAIPTLERIKSTSHLSQEQGNFIEWLKSQKGLVLCEWTEFEDAPDQYLQSTISLERLLAEYWEIDLEKAEAERRALIKYEQDLNGSED